MQCMCHGLFCVATEGIMSIILECVESCRNELWVMVIVILFVVYILCHVCLYIRECIDECFIHVYKCSRWNMSGVAWLGYPLSLMLPSPATSSVTASVSLLRDRSVTL